MSKKEKVIAPEKLERIKQREAKELAKWQAEKAKPKKNFYAIYMLAICAVINLADDLCSNLGTQMKSILATVFFEPVFGAEYAIARMDAFAMITFLFYGFAFLYKVLADRYGRRIFLIVNTFGMGIAMICIGLATNIPVYLVGACFVTFFTPHDLQMSYIMESAPPQHRAKYSAVIKALSALATVLVPLLRNAFVSSVDYSQWRMVYLIPSLVAFVGAIVAMLTIRETDAFVEMRIRQLTMTEAEKAAEKLNKKQDTTSRGGIFKGIKFIFTHKQMLWLVLGYGAWTFCNSFATSYEPILTMNYTQTFMTSGLTLEAAKQASIDFVSQCLLMIPFGTALTWFAQGFVSDKLGRKPAAVILAISTILFLCIGYMGVYWGLPALLLGFLIGAGYGSFCAASENMFYIINESSPTNLRTSVASMFPVVSGQFSLMAMALNTILLNVLGDLKIIYVNLITCIPGLIVALLVLIFKIKETRGIDLTTIKGDEFET